MNRINPLNVGGLPKKGGPYMCGIAIAGPLDPTAYPRVRCSCGLDVPCADYNDAELVQADHLEKVHDMHQQEN